MDGRNRNRNLTMLSSHVDEGLVIWKTRARHCELVSMSYRMVSFSDQTSKRQDGKRPCFIHDGSSYKRRHCGMLCLEDALR